ncbi:MAG: hypothetical protein NVS3B20_13680 [Polyangiales bacterium]
MQFSLPAHSYSHDEGNWKDVMPIYQRWIARFVAHMMTSLDVQESASSPRTFLDNSLVVFNHNLSIGNAHLRYDLPTLVGGSLGGRFVNGKMIDFTSNTAHTVTNNMGKKVGVDFNRWLVTVLQGFGLTEADYQQPGQPPGFGSDHRHAQCSAALDTSMRRLPLPGILKP